MTVVGVLARPGKRALTERFVDVALRTFLFLESIGVLISTRGEWKRAGVSRCGCGGGGEGGGGGSPDKVLDESRNVFGAAKQVSEVDCRVVRGEGSSKNQTLLAHGACVLFSTD